MTQPPCDSVICLTYCLMNNALLFITKDDDGSQRVLYQSAPRSTRDGNKVTFRIEASARFMQG